MNSSRDEEVRQVCAPFHLTRGELIGALVLLTSLGLLMAVRTMRYVRRAGRPITVVAGVDEAPMAAIDINQATARQLQQLPGIGSVRARAIVRYRERRGGIRSIDELAEIPGIGPTLLAQLKEYLHTGERRGEDSRVLE